MTIDTAEPRAPAPRILLVDSSPIQSWFFARLCADCGFTCRQVGGAEALRAELLGTGNSAAQADLCCVELHLEGGNGFALGQQLMQDTGLPCVLLAGPLKPTDREWAQVLGFAAALERPCSAQQLRELVGRLAC